jgi:hypothetical protein
VLCAGCRGEPDSFGGSGAQGDGAGWRGEREGLVVVAFDEAEFGAGADAAVFEKF